MVELVKPSDSSGYRLRTPRPLLEATDKLFELAADLALEAVRVRCHHDLASWPLPRQ